MRLNKTKRYQEREKKREININKNEISAKYKANFFKQIMQTKLQFKTKLACGWRAYSKKKEENKVYVMKAVNLLM